MALSPAAAFADEYGIANTQGEGAPVAQNDSGEATDLAPINDPVLVATDETLAVNPGYEPSRTDVVPTQGQPGFTPSQAPASPVINNTTPNADTPAGTTEQRPIATKPIEPVKAVTPYQQLTEGLSPRAKNIVKTLFNGNEDPNYGYDQFKQEARAIANQEALYKRAPWLRPSNPRREAMFSLKVMGIRAILRGNNAIKRRLQEDKSFDFDWVLKSVSKY